MTLWCYERKTRYSGAIQQYEVLWQMCIMQAAIPDYAAFVCGAPSVCAASCRLESPGRPIPAALWDLAALPR